MKVLTPDDLFEEIKRVFRDRFEVPSFEELDCTDFEGESYDFKIDDTE